MTWFTHFSGLLHRWVETGGQVAGLWKCSRCSTVVGIDSVLPCLSLSIPFRAGLTFLTSHDVLPDQREERKEMTKRRGK